MISLGHLHLVLVRTENPANIGACARALANMGGDRLILIDPHCEIGPRSTSLAAGARPKLDSALTYADWNDFYAHEGEGLRIALTRRGGQQRPVHALTSELTAIQTKPEHIYLILGPEADGLAATDLAHANLVCHLPVYGSFASLNLAQAALLGLYLVRARFPPAEDVSQTTVPPEIPVRAFFFPDELIKEWLTAMGFDVEARKASAFLTLRRLFLQRLPTRHEIQVLEAVLRQNIRKLGSRGFTATSLGFTPEQVIHQTGDIPVQDI